jgi:hypothetical protein
MTMVTADFPAAIECGTNVIATLLERPWDAEFGPEFGPWSGGGAPFEWLMGLPPVDANSLAPIEALQTRQIDALHPIEALESVLSALLASPWSSAFSPAFGPFSGGGMPAEWLMGLPPVEADSFAPLEMLSTLSGDQRGVAEVQLSVGADPWAAGEGLSTQRADLTPELEAGSAVPADASAPAEGLATLPPVLANIFAPIEALATQRIDWHPVEWAAVFQSDAAQPFEGVLAVRADPGGPSESIAVYRLDLEPVLEALSAAARSDLVPPVEALLSAVRDGALIEAGSSMQLDQSAAAEALGSLVGDQDAPAEAGGSIARTDAVAPLEALLTALGARGALAEWLATVQPVAVIGNANAPFEWAAVFGTDSEAAAEWAALFTADQWAVIESLLGLPLVLANNFAPVEAGAALPAPTLYVGRGRLAVSPGRRRLLGPQPN